MFKKGEVVWYVTETRSDNLCVRSGVVRRDHGSQGVSLRFKKRKLCYQVYPTKLDAHVAMSKLESFVRCCRGRRSSVLSKADITIVAGEV